MDDIAERSHGLALAARRDSLYSPQAVPFSFFPLGKVERLR
jgi:hypothetical protein